MPRATALTALLGIEHPLIQAPMGGAVTPALAAAVSGAGLGSLGSSVLAPEAVITHARAVREITDRPFNVNFLLPSAADGGGIGRRPRSAIA